MSNNGEDIIRETFEKLGDAIGVQMQIPDAMIANLGAVLQAQIDLLAELQSVGRLIPAGGMAFTAEQVEDVRTVLGLNGSQDITVVLDAQARLRALFPATEPAEDGWGDVNPNDPQGRTYRETAEEYYSAPAEPAEEETKAEESQNIEVMQWDGTRKSIQAICDWVNSFDDDLDDHTISYCFMSTTPDDVFDVFIATLEGDMRVSPNDFVIQGVQGEFYPCKPDIFEQTYDGVSS